MVLLLIEYIDCPTLSCLYGKILYNIGSFIDSTINLFGYVVVILEMWAFKKMLSLFEKTNSIDDKELGKLR